MIFKYHYVPRKPIVEKPTELPTQDIYKEQMRWHKGIYARDHFGTVYGTGYTGVSYFSDFDARY